ncbi:MAG: adenylate/guanylate cyclase domain-containing protein, partial [Chromatocurvus sp.]
ELGVHAAIAMQRWAHDDREMCEQGLGLRVGLHHGRVLAEDSDIFGSTVNTAARMVALAGSAQIVMSRSTRDAVDASLQGCCRDLGTTYIPGRQEPLGIVSVIWEEDTSNLTAVPTGIGLDASAAPRHLVLIHAGKQVTLSEESPPITLGRGTDCNVVIDVDCVSRHHARIEFRHGFFVLVDQSTNGTWLAVEGQSPALVHRGELSLLRDGLLSLGKRGVQGGIYTLSYHLQDA